MLTPPGPPLTLALALLVLASPRPLPAASDSPYTLSWAADAPVMALAAGAAVLPQVFLDELVGNGGPYRSASINPLDRWVTRQHSGAANTTSDVLLWSMVALPFAADALDVGLSRRTWAGWAVDAVVIAQALLVNEAVNQLVKVTVQRPRPLLYDRPSGDPSHGTADNHLSFYSGHTSNTFAAGMAWAGTFARRHPTSPWRWAAFGGATLAGGTVGLMRVLAGKHFVTDVAVGALMGTAIGLGVPWLHERSAGKPSVVAWPAPGGALVVLDFPLQGL
jgi:membrane-associated phospholipid phosphatase